MAIDPKLLVIKPVDELTEVTGLQSGSLLFYNGGDNLKRISIDTFNNLSKTAKPLKPTDITPTQEGLYMPTESGNYTNAGGLIAKVGYETLFFYNGTTWTKTEVLINAIEDVNLISTTGLVDTYQIDYTNGGSFQYEIRNGKDAKPQLNSDNDVLWITDKNDNVVAVIDNSGDYKNPDFPEGINKELKENKKSFGIQSNQNLYEFRDKQGNLISYINKDSSMYFSEMKNSPVQSLYKDVLGRETNDSRLFFKPESIRYLNQVLFANNGHAPAPYGLLPQEYTVPNNIINSLTLTAPIGHISIDTPYRLDDEVVHPHVIEFASEFRGFKYWMALNPYSQGVYENPVIYGSNDKIEWEMLTGFDQPLASPKTYNYSDAYLSDNFWVYNPLNGELICVWRRTTNVGFGEVYTLEYRSTKDGYTWSEITVMNIPNAGNLYSPSILFDFNTKQFIMWCADDVSLVGIRTCKTMDGLWSASTQVPFYATGVWHLEVKYIGDKYLMLINKRDPDSAFYLAISSDGFNWTQGSQRLYSGEALYKASFLPIILGNTLKLNIIWTTNHTVNPANARKLYNSNTNTITI